jgi:hypothetical protein
MYFLIKANDYRAVCIATTKRKNKTPAPGIFSQMVSGLALIDTVTYGNI